MVALESSIASPVLVSALTGGGLVLLGASYTSRDLCTDTSRMRPETQVSPASMLESITNEVRQVVKVL